MSPTPPASPEKGDRYIIVATATGAWEGHEGSIAWWDGDAWRIDGPFDGWQVYNLDNATIYLYHVGWNPIQVVGFGGGGAGGQRPGDPVGEGGQGGGGDGSSGGGAGDGEGEDGMPETGGGGGARVGAGGSGVILIRYVL